jgi:hypothetical protein
MQTPIHIFQDENTLTKANKYVTRKVTVYLFIYLCPLIHSLLRDLIILFIDERKQPSRKLGNKKLVLVGM